MQPTSVAHAVQTARRHFFEQGQSVDGLVPDTILRSWQRCFRMGLTVTDMPHLEPLSEGQLRQARERSEPWHRLCQPELQSLYADAHDTNSMVILTDAQGLVLESLGNPDFITEAQRVALLPGVIWHEASTGTNAIGTALAERRAVEVRGAEHYFDPHHILSCYAAPIFDPRGAVIGALDISGRADIAHTHALGMVRMAVDQIEHRFFDDLPAHCEVLRLHNDAAMLGTAREGVLVFRDRCLIAANRFGLGLLGLDWMVLGRQRFDELFATRPRQLANVTHLDLLDGRKLHVRSMSSTVLQVPVHTPIRQDVEPIQVCDAHWQQLQADALTMLDADIPVLVQGETGTGKEVFVRQLHASSRWHTGPFVAVNCAALPASLIEAELFGYTTGAFTGANKQGAPGVLRQAHGGVLLLDEIGDMPLELQSRLLRVLQDRSVTPLGGGKAIPVQFALVCSTHRPLSQLVAEGQFRADLYYRIAHHEVQLPALRDQTQRSEQIQSLWRQLHDHHAHHAFKALPAAVLDALAAHEWPGNYRQLHAVLRRLQVIASTRANAMNSEPWLTLNDLPAEIRTPAPHTATAAADLLVTQEEAAMKRALQQCAGNVSAAARLLGINRSTLYRRIGKPDNTTH